MCGALYSKKYAKNADVSVSDYNGINTSSTHNRIYTRNGKRS